jgi:hypothetical protein
MPLRRALLLLFPLLAAVPARAQQSAPVRLVIREGGRETGREEFTLQDGRGRGAPGTTLTATARYPATNPTTRLAAVLERTPESAIAKFQLDVEGPDGPTVILAAGSGARLIVRTVAKGSESGRELPGGPDVILLDEALYSLYVTVAALATPAGRQLTAIYPRTGKRASFTARLESTGAGGDVQVALSGGISGSLVVDAAGRVKSIELPGPNISVTRVE